MKRQNEDAWREAQRLCRLSGEDVRKAKALGFRPKSLIRNIPSRSQQWKAPVNEWVRSLYEEKFGARAPVSEPAPPSSQGEERRDVEHPWPDHPDIPTFRLSTSRSGSPI